MYETFNFVKLKKNTFTAKKSCFIYFTAFFFLICENFVQPTQLNTDPSLWQLVITQKQQLRSQSCNQTYFAQKLPQTAKRLLAKMCRYFVCNQLCFFDPERNFPLSRRNTMLIDSVYTEFLERSTTVFNLRYSSKKQLCCFLAEYQEFTLNCKSKHGMAFRKHSTGFKLRSSMVKYIFCVLHEIIR